MLKFLAAYRRLVWLVLAEAFGVLLLVAFVVGLATMPPLGARPNPKSPLHFSLTVDGAAWWANFNRYGQMLLHGSLGVDREGYRVAPMLTTFLAHSLLLLGLATLIAIALGVCKGFYDFQSMHKRRVALAPLITGAISGLPDFWLVLMLQVMAAWLWRTLDFNAFKVSYDPTQPAASLVYPVIALSLIPLSQVARVTSTAMGNVFGQDYIRTARAKGLQELIVVYKHALRNALVQILDSLPGVLVAMLSNLLVVEYLFSYPGLTQLLLKASRTAVDRTGAMQGMDAPVLIAAGISLGLIFSLFYLMIRFLRTVVDPRLRGRRAS
ncbi:MAG: ABC transporter permease subunit [Mycobacterium leprae]